MALTDSQKASRLFKKSLGAGETILARDFFEEPKLGNNNILPSQIWAQADQIPATAPVLSDGQISGVTQYFSKLALTHVAGSTNLAYYHSGLTDTIPFNYSDGSYNYALYKTDGTTQIAFGQGDWLVDTSAGLLTFYGTLPSGVDSTNPPKISFYKYVGEKGLISSGSTTGIASLSTALSVEVSDRVSGDTSLTTAISNEISDRTIADTSLTTEISNTVTGLTTLSTALSTEVSIRTAEDLTFLKLSGGTMTGTIDMGSYQIISSGSPLGDLYLTNKAYVDAVAQGVSPHAPVKVVSTSDLTLSGVTTVDGISLVEGDYVLVAGQTAKQYNGIYVVHSGTSVWTRRLDADGDPDSEIELGDFVFVETGTTNGSSGWVLGKTDSPDMPITPDVDTQEWFKMAAPGSYTTDGEGIELNGNVFSLELSGNTLEKSAFGIKVSDTLSTAISTNTSNITALSGTSSAISSLSSAISYNSSVIDVLSGATDSLSTAISTTNSTLSTAITGFTSSDLSLSTAISGTSTSLTSLSTGLSTEISNLISTDTVLSLILTGTSSSISSLSTAVNTLSSTDLSLSTALTGLTTSIGSLSTAVSTLTDSDISLSTAITGLTTSLNSLSSALSVEISNRISGDTSLTTAISNEISDRISGDTSLTTAISNSITGLTSLTTAISNEISSRVSGDTSLTTALSNEISDRVSGDTSLTTALSNEISDRIIADTSLETALNNKSGVTTQTAGSGLTYLSGDTTLNVNVDNWTIRIINDTLHGAQQWIQDSGSITVTQGTSGATITLSKDPVTPVSAYINGIEYLVNPTSSGPTTNRPFFYNAYPPVTGTQIWFDTVTAGFDIASGTDMVMIKYLIVENLVQ